jgi:dephospho-CoA kinase
VLRVGLTGGIGAGKSAAAARLRELGATVVDADALARDVVAPGTDGLADVVAAFGPGILAADGSLDRPALASIVFTDDAQRRRLEAITHPRVGARMGELLAMAEASGAPAVVYDVPLLVETNQAAGYDAVLVVEAPRELRLTRLERRGVDRAEAQRRMAMQADDAARRAVATVVLDNAGSLAQLHDQVDRAWAQLLAT